MVFPCETGNQERVDIMDTQSVLQSGGRGTL